MAIPWESPVPTYPSSVLPISTNAFAHRLEQPTEGSSVMGTPPTPMPELYVILLFPFNSFVTPYKNEEYDRVTDSKFQADRYPTDLPSIRA